MRTKKNIIVIYLLKPLFSMVDFPFDQNITVLERLEGQFSKDFP